MEIIGRISKGSKMDQIYIPKSRIGMPAGEYVIILPLENKLQKKKQEKKQKQYFYNTKGLEPIKLRVIEEIFSVIKKQMSPENIIITGSFLEKGFMFNDIDILIVNKQEIDTEIIKKQVENLTGIKTHIILIDKKTLILGLSSDPLYVLMLSKCISQNRLIFKIERNIYYKILDLHLLKSKALIDNFNILSGNEKYYLTLNMVSILRFIQNKKLSKEIINEEIEKMFSININELKENLVKEDFLKKYKKIYIKTFNLILKNIKKRK